MGSEMCIRDRWSSLVARRAHNPKVAGSNPAPATTQKARKLTVSGPFSSEAVLQKGRACTKDVPAQGVPCVCCAGSCLTLQLRYGPDTIVTRDAARFQDLVYLPQAVPADSERLKRLMRDMASVPHACGAEYSVVGAGWVCAPWSIELVAA